MTAADKKRPRSPGRLALADILDHADHNGLYRYPDGHEIGALAKGVVHLHGQELTSKLAMLDAVAAALSFPDYFGRNWDALEDCLLDLAWWQGGVAILIDDAQLPESQAPAEWRELLEIFHDAARYWKTAGRPFAVFLQGSHAAWPRIDIA